MTTAPTHASTNLEDLLAHAAALHRAEHGDEAAAIYHDILSRDPYQPDALHLLGVLAAQQKDYPAAIRWIKQAIDSNPNIPDFHLHLGRAWLAWGHPEPAIGVYRGMLLRWPDHAEALADLAQATVVADRLAMECVTLGCRLLDQKHYDAAESFHRKAQKLQPNDPKINNYLGLTLLQMNRVEEAIEQFQRATTIDPAFSFAYNNLGSALQRLNRLPEAEQSFRLAIAYTPHFAEALANLGSVLRQQNRLNESIALYRQAVMESPKNPDILYNLGNALATAEDYVSAINVYRQAAELRPNHFETHFNLALTEQSGGLFRAAADSYRIALSLRPNDPIVHHNMGVTLQGLGNDAGAFLHLMRHRELVMKDALTQRAETILQALTKSSPSPTTGRRNLILTLAVHYHSSHLRPFVESLRAVGYQGEIVMFIGDTDAETLHYLRSRNVELASVDSFDWMGAHMSLARYACYADYLESRFYGPESLRPARVLLADSRDVVFQADPFSQEDASPLTFALEHPVSVFRAAGTNENWIEAGFGSERLMKLHGRRVVCSGTTFGSFDGIRYYLARLLAAALDMRRDARFVPGIDQGLHNHLIYAESPILDASTSSVCEETKISGPFSLGRLAKNGDGVATLAFGVPDGIWIDEHNCVRTMSGSPAPVVHQYDRIERLARAVNAAYNVKSVE
ncbi:hypothetical protein CCP2SC5_230027 [Azospirillaceae bacterium]